MPMKPERGSPLWLTPATTMRARLKWAGVAVALLGLLAAALFVAALDARLWS